MSLILSLERYQCQSNCRRSICRVIKISAIVHVQINNPAPSDAMYTNCMYEHVCANWKEYGMELGSPLSLNTEITKFWSLPLYPSLNFTIEFIFKWNPLHTWILHFEPNFQSYNFFLHCWDLYFVYTCKFGKICVFITHSEKREWPLCDTFMPTKLARLSDHAM